MNRPEWKVERSGKPKETGWENEGRQQTNSERNNRIEERNSVFEESER